MTTSYERGDGSGTSATLIRGLRQTWFPRRAIRAATSAGSSVPAASGRGSQSASSRNALTVELPVVGFELDQLQGVLERIDREEAATAGDLAVVVAGRDAGRLQVGAQRRRVLDLEARVASRSRVHRDPVRLAEQKSEEQ